LATYTPGYFPLLIDKGQRSIIPRGQTWGIHKQIVYEVKIPSPESPCSKVELEQRNLFSKGELEGQSPSKEIISPSLNKGGG
jgi:hypothetical protein